MLGDMLLETMANLFKFISGLSGSFDYLVERRPLMGFQDQILQVGDGFSVSSHPDAQVRP